MKILILFVFIFQISYVNADEIYKLIKIPIYQLDYTPIGKVVNG